MSVWTSMLGAYQQIPRWPSPFRGQMRRLRVLACNDGWLADIEFNGRIWGQFLWTDFIPQPTEIIRKSVTGSYKCGFYLDIEVKSPLDIIWKDESASRFLAKLAHIPVTGLFLWWASETAVDALSTWSTVALLEAQCKDPDATASMFLGSTFTGVDGPGAIAGYAERWGNHAYSDPAVGSLTPGTAGGTVHGYGTFQIANREVDTVMVGYTPSDPVTGFPTDPVIFSSPAVGSNHSWATPGKFIPFGAHISIAIYVKFKAGSSGFGVTFGAANFNIFTDNRADENPPPLPTPEQQPSCLDYGAPPPSGMPPLPV